MQLYNHLHAYSAQATVLILLDITILANIRSVTSRMVCFHLLTGMSIVPRVSLGSFFFISVPYPCRMFSAQDYSHKAWRLMALTSTIRGSNLQQHHLNPEDEGCSFFRQVDYEIPY